MSDMYRSTPSSPSSISDARSIVVLVGRTGLDAALRLDETVELVRVKSASEAIAAVATESAARANDNAPMAVIVSEEVRDSLSVHDQAGTTGVQRFGRVLRNLRPDVEVMFLGMDGVTPEMITQATRPAKDNTPAREENPPINESLARTEPVFVPQQSLAPDELPTNALKTSSPNNAASDTQAPHTIVDDGVTESWAEVPTHPANIYPHLSDASTQIKSNTQPAEPFAPTTLAAFASDVPPAAQPTSAALVPPPLSQVVPPIAKESTASSFTQNISQPRIDAPPASSLATGMLTAGLSAGSGLPSMQSPLRAPAPVRSTIAAPLVPPAVVSTAAFGAIHELGSAALFGSRRDDASAEITVNTPGDALLVRSLLNGQDLQPIAMELLRSRTSDNSLEVLSQPAPGKLSVPMGDGLGWLSSARAERADTLRPHAAWLAGWLRLRDQQTILADAALKDALTGAWNRRYLDAFLARVLQQARESRQFVTVMLFDIDNFKQFNDAHGHDAGDAILKEVVDLMRGMVRPSDRVCRIGGDEFAVVFQDPQGPRQIGSRHPSTVEEIARRFQLRVAEHKFSKIAPGSKLTISGGLATFPWDGLHQADLLAHADALSLESKRAGKNAIVLGS
jgi:diguanylate cyclase (GGDEF)-like protein